MAKKKKQSLGKGLDALLGEKALLAQKDDKKNDSDANQALTTSEHNGNASFAEIAIADIKALSTQPRKDFNDELLQQLADSIASQGVLQPIIVRRAEQGYELIAGERRWRAAQKAGLETIPALIREEDNGNSHVIALLENIQRQDLNAIEVSEALQTLHTEYSISHADIATALGMSRPAISNLLRLAELSPSIKNMVIDGAIDMGHARAILSVAIEERLSFSRHVADNKLTVRQTEALAKQWPIKKTAKEAQKQDIDIHNFARKCSETIGAKVVIQHNSSGKGKLTIHYINLEQLHKITENLSPQLGVDANTKEK